MSSFDADALDTDKIGLKFLAETIESERRSDDAFRGAFDPSSRSDCARAARVFDVRRAAMVLAGEHA